jgi:tetratricopeptide (TPR) repeat protein
VLQRHHGTWQFHEIADLDTLLDHIPDTKWSAEWTTFNDQERALVGLLRLVPRGLRKEHIEAALSQEPADLHELTLRGWIMQTDQGLWRVASPEAARAAVPNGGTVSWGPVQDRLFAAVSAELEREEVGFLRALRAESVEDLEEGLWVIGREAALGRHKEAGILAEHCRRRAQALDDRSLFERTSLALATALHRVGSDREAKEVLGTSDFEINNALREHLLGVIARAQGDHSRARGHLARAVDAAEAGSDARTALSSHAELAEIDWRYGDRQTKSLSIGRVRQALSRSQQWTGVEEERAGLSYQLGSALILTGEREQAREVLEDALATKPGDYWCMRLANALATAEYYLGRFESALRWMDEAWRRAENGGIDSFKARILSNRAGIYYGVGRFQDAVAMHRLSGTWARRTGNLFECSAACSGAAANLMMIAEYEKAIVAADEAKEISIQIGNEYQTAKSMELSALIRFFIGDYESARSTAEDAIARMSSFGESDVSPRLDWLLARLMRHGGNTDAARVLLARAEQALGLSRDWEDLPGVQIELELIRARDGDTDGALERILGISREANRSRALANLLGSAVAIGEILVERGINHIECREVMSLALSRAQTAGAAEAAWQLNYLLGILFVKDGDARSGSARLGQALRGFREVADRLSPVNRSFYLRTPHGAGLLASFSASKG